MRRNSMDAFTNMPLERQDRDEVRGRGCGRPADRRRAARPRTTTCCSRRARARRSASPATDVREFQSRNSTGVRGMTAEGRRRGHLAVDPAPRRRHAGGARGLSARRAVEGRARARADAERRAHRASCEAAEQFILTVCANGYGKLSSAYEYRRTGRGGQGITNIDNIARNGPVVASFPATQRRSS